MSYKSYPWFTGAVPMAAYDPTPGVEANVDNRYNENSGKFSGFIVGTLGDASTPEITLYMLDGSLLVIKDVQPGVPYAIPNRGVQNTSSNMFDIWVLKG